MIQNKYEITDLIGRGSYGRVYKCHDKFNNTFAMKVIPKHRTSESQEKTAKKIENEIRTLKKLQTCPNVVRYFETYEDSENVHIIMEHCNGKDLLNNGTMNESSLIYVASQIVNVLEACHTNNIVHADVKPANFCWANTSLKAIDFGCCRNERGNSIMGTPAYMSPEVLAKQFSYKSDVWSLGITLFWLYTMEFPYWDRSILELQNSNLFEAISSNPLRLHRLNLMSDIGRDFIGQCLQKKEEDRLSSFDAKRHPWLNLYRI